MQQHLYSSRHALSRQYVTTAYAISCPATQVRWRRIVLDEAHNIKDRQCSTAKAVFALASKYKWALSGTPLQNRVSESLRIVVHLLGLQPQCVQTLT